MPEVKPPRCIVCDKEIKPVVRLISFVPATLNGRKNGERDKYGSTIYLDAELRPRTREECSRWANGRIRKIWDYGETISAFNVWDGETYVDPHFHSERCAAIFGRQMAKRGYR